MRLVVVCFFLLTSAYAIAQIAPSAAKWKRDLTRSAHLEWGLDAPIATFAAQIHQESGFNPDARSPVGAIGLAQFMPKTAEWISGAYSALAANDPQNPTWALRALVTYDKYLWERTTAIDGCNRMAKALSSFNGGLAWIIRDEGLALKRGLNPEYWWGAVEVVNAGRGAAFWTENRNYVSRILTTLEATYIRAGWGSGMCWELS